MIIITVPVWPVDGEKAVISNGGGGGGGGGGVVVSIKVNVPRESAPEGVTRVIFPEEPVPTKAYTRVSDNIPIEAAGVPPKLMAEVEARPVPEIDTFVPGGPVIGVKE